MNLEDRLTRLEALRDIETLKSHYAALADAKYTAAHQRVPPAEWTDIARQQAECFTEDAIWDGGASFGGPLQGRAALNDWFTRSPWRFAFHIYTAPQITLTSDISADATWRLWQIAIRDGETNLVLLAATTAESYRKEQHWLISRMRFSQIHTVELPASKLESLIKEGLLF